MVKTSQSIGSLRLYNARAGFYLQVLPSANRLKLLRLTASYSATLLYISIKELLQI